MDLSNYQFSSIHCLRTELFIFEQVLLEGGFINTSERKEIPAFYESARNSFAGLTTDNLSQFMEPFSGESFFALQLDNESIPQKSMQVVLIRKQPIDDSFRACLEVNHFEGVGVVLVCYFVKKVGDTEHQWALPFKIANKLTSFLGIQMEDEMPVDELHDLEREEKALKVFEMSYPNRNEALFVHLQ